MSAIDEALEVVRPVLSDGDSSRALVGARCLGLLAGYDARWRESPYRIEAVENVVTSDLYNPETEHTSRTFTLAGKIDVIATEIQTGRRVVIDHKTTSQDIGDPNSPFWRQLVVEGQVSHYMLLEFLNGEKVDYALWDVVHKPATSPRLLPKAEQLRTGAERESLEEYAARLSRDCIEDRPHWYFQRRPVPRLDAEIHEYASELWDHSQDLIVARRTGRWPRNSGACMLYGSPCKFLGICSGYDSPESENWTRKEWVHPELPPFDGDGREILTNSRIRAFQTCRRKHQLQYEIGIERVDDEEREVLFFGNLFHEALERYFLALQTQQQKGN